MRPSIHGYFDADFDMVWETTQQWLPELLKQLPAVRQDINDENPSERASNKPC
jgi:uncharacterized protein with HEPN domain